VQVALAVLKAEEAGIAVVAALDDVERNIAELDAGASGHLAMITQDNCH
jgi:hypothetical protein